MTNHIGLFSVSIADPTRRAVIERLVDGPASVSELSEPHAMALPSFLKHLGRLERAGLVRTIKSGRPRMVHIDPTPLGLAEGWLARQRRLWEGCTDRLALLAEALERGTPRPPDPQGLPP
ncbi:ArsR/SmtB family transcription factor [Sagittula salina]|uniref:Winged helix-turn-helix transcriptional regulator n=1 Tax=Sagittula salina TaxID=2820268 RepID=A0A940S498_9RHOB|nr:metalloregulator ArsR/SmtB family transcription factor [Sagittula salina]MBP0483859.1 winged helix-turn-helix transcriptional regulator [Sagittula salina]